MKGLLIAMLFGAGTSLAQTAQTPALQKQAHMLNILYTEAADAKGADKAQRELAYFHAFPASFLQFSALYGYDDSGDSTAYGALHSNPEHIRLFGSLTEVPRHEYYSKYVSIACTGSWQEGNLNTLQNGLKNKVLADTRTFVEVLKGREEKEVRGFFHFLFDGIQPGDALARATFEKIYAKIKKQDPDMAALLQQEYRSLAGEIGHAG